MELRAKYTLFAEGCRGSLSKQLMQRFNLRDGRDPQTYGIGIKELWEIPAANHQPGLIEHSLGWPLDSATYGGSFLYHFGDNLVSYGFVRRPGLSQSLAFAVRRDAAVQDASRHAQAFRGGPAHHLRRAGADRGRPAVDAETDLSRRALIGDAAGFLNVPKIKGTHTAMKSGMLAAEAVADALAGDRPAELVGYTERIRDSWVWEELSKVRNVRPAFAKFGRWGGFLYSALDTVLLRGKAPWTLHHPHADNETLTPAETAPRIVYPRPDGVLTFDRLSSVFISNTNHEENQPAHLKLLDPSRAIEVNWDRYRSPEVRYCPAGGLRDRRCRGRLAAACRSTRRIACTAKRATSRIRRRTSTG